MTKDRHSKYVAPTVHTIASPLAAAIISIDVELGQYVEQAQVMAVLESMKMQTALTAAFSGTVQSIDIGAGDTVQAGQRLFTLATVTSTAKAVAAQTESPDKPSDTLQRLNEQLSATQDDQRQEAIARRHAKGFRSARENVRDLCDPESLLEYGQLAVAAQRGRMSQQALESQTPADGVITGLATINSDVFGQQGAQVAVIVNDYTVLAGTQGYFHHKKLDRILDQAGRSRLPVVMYTEGGGGRPGDTDVNTQIAGLDVPSFARWATLSGHVPLITVNNGYCFAGNAALFGCGDVRIATKKSWIGMAGPAMIEGGGLGSFKPTDIGAIEVQSRNGVVDLIADDEAHATALARQCLSYFQGDIESWQSEDQDWLRTCMPADRRYSYDIRGIIRRLADSHSFLELSQYYGGAIVTGFARIEGKAIGLIANDCKVIGGAIDAEAADKAARFMRLCGSFSIPILSLCDTPGFMVGPASEEQGAVNRMSALFIAGAQLSTALVTIFLRKGYGLGAMAMAGGSFHRPQCSMAWPTGEFGAMGLEGAVQLGFKKELAAAKDEVSREALFNELLDLMYEKGRATEAAAHLEIDGVIDPASTRAIIMKAFRSHGAFRAQGA